MRPLSPDTSSEAQQILVERWRRMPPWKKAHVVNLLSRDCEQLAIAGIRSERPDVDSRGERLLLAIRRLGRELALRAFGDDPMLERRR